MGGRSWKLNEISDFGGYGARGWTLLDPTSSSCWPFRVISSAIYHRVWLNSLWETLGFELNFDYGFLNPDRPPVDNQTSQNFRPSHFLTSYLIEQALFGVYVVLFSSLRLYPAHQVVLPPYDRWGSTFLLRFNLHRLVTRDVLLFRIVLEVLLSSNVEPNSGDLHIWLLQSQRVPHQRHVLHHKLRQRRWWSPDILATCNRFDGRIQQAVRHLATLTSPTSNLVPHETTLPPIRSATSQAKVQNEKWLA